MYIPSFQLKIWCSGQSQGPRSEQKWNMLSLYLNVNEQGYNGGLFGRQHLAWMYILLVPKSNGHQHILTDGWKLHTRDAINI